MFRGFVFLFGAPTVMAQGQSVRHKYWRIISKVEEKTTAKLKDKQTSITSVPD
jgi:hypothetical protein